MARQKLAARQSLGWTDLDKAVQAALAQCGPKTQVVYIGDGIVTTGDADPVAFAKRLRRMAEGKPGTFHAVAVSSSFEPGVLKAIAAIGGGSFRQVSGSHGPAAVAMELLGEITQPVLRDMKIEFRGLRTARVYPDPLPNLPPGTQQIILGRYAPQGKDQTGEVIVSGTLGGKPVKYLGQGPSPRLRRRTGAERRQLVHSAAVGPHAPRYLAGARRFAGHQGRDHRPVAKSTTSSRPIRRSWCWRPTPTASGSA